MSLCRHIGRVVLLCIVLASASLAYAQDEETDNGFGLWVLGLTLQTDEQQSESIYTTLNWGVTDDTWLYFAAGRSTSPTNRADITTNDLIASVDHNFGWLGASFEIEQWGEKDAVESFDYRGSLYFHGDRFNVGVELERRAIDLPFSLIGPRDRPVQRTVEMPGEGTGLFFRFDLTDWWRVYGSARQYDYSRNLTVLPRLDVINLLSTSALTLSNSFLEDDQRLGFEWRAGRSLINLGFGRNHSAVDQSRLDSINASVLFPVSYRVDLEVNIGQSSYEGFEPSLFGGVMILIYGVG